MNQHWQFAARSAVFVSRLPIVVACLSAWEKVYPTTPEDASFLPRIRVYRLIDQMPEGLPRICECENTGYEAGESSNYSSD